MDQNGDAHLVGTIALIPQIVDAVMIPVVAAGGIMDGRGIAAALALALREHHLEQDSWLQRRAAHFKPTNKDCCKRPRLIL
ncbi:MAG TPA: nitronate monooxygenase [Nitrososphaera sp.]